MLRDRNGALWIGASSGGGGGLLHVHQGRTDVFAHSDGLSGEGVQTLFEDRENNIWVATVNGLDRFRDFAVATLTEDQGLSNDIALSVLADRAGSVWLASFGGLNRWSHGQITIPPRAAPGREWKVFQRKRPKFSFSRRSRARMGFHISRARFPGEWPVKLHQGRSRRKCSFYRPRHYRQYVGDQRGCRSPSHITAK